MFPNISPAAFMTCISIHRSKNLLRGPCRACRTGSPRRSKSWKPFHSSGRRPSWELFLKALARCEAAASYFDGREVRMTKRTSRPTRGGPYTDAACRGNDDAAQVLDVLLEIVPLKRSI